MTIQEAIRSGKRFKRKIWDVGKELEAGEILFQYAPNSEDILATDWEIKDEKIEITREQLRQAFTRCSKVREDYAQRTFTVVSEEMLAIALGFNS